MDNLRIIRFVVLNTVSFAVLISCAQTSQNIEGEVTPVFTSEATIQILPFQAIVLGTEDITEMVPRITQSSENTTIPSQTPISTGTPRKQILIQFTAISGDGVGGSKYDFVLVSPLPKLILYVDGLLLIDGSHIGIPEWYLSKNLTTTEICKLLNDIHSTGYFDAEGDGLKPNDPIYVTPRESLGDGMGSYVLTINGSPDKFVHIYGPAVNLLVPSVHAAYSLLSEFQPDGMVRFHQSRFILRVDPNPDSEWPIPSTSMTMRSWPDNFPSLSTISLLPENERFFVMEGDQAASLLQDFDMPGGNLVEENGKEYLVVGRPLLPHETLNYYSTFEWESISFDLPFSCDEH